MNNHTDICNQILSAQSILMILDSQDKENFDISISAIMGCKLLLKSILGKLSGYRDACEEISDSIIILDDIYLESKPESWDIEKSHLMIVSKKVGKAAEKIEEAYFE